MKIIYKFFITILLLTILTGCGTTKTSLRPEAKAQIHTIALIKISEPETYVAQDFGNIGMMFGAAGAAAAGGSSASAGKSVASVTAGANYKAGKRFTNQLVRKLSASGYKVKLVSVKRKDKTELLENYDAVIKAVKVDAVLDVAIESIGYATEHPMLSPHWRPASQIHVAMIDTGTGGKIYSEKFMYGYHNPFMSGTDIEAPENYHFDNADELFASDRKLIKGLNHSVDAVADQIVSTLKK